MGPRLSTKPSRMGFAGEDQYGEGARPSWKKDGVKWGDLEEKQSQLAAQIYFSTGSSTLSVSASDVLSKLAIDLRSLLIHGDRIEISCEGCADPRPFWGNATPQEGEAANLRLSEFRAKAVKEDLNALLAHPHCTVKDQGWGVHRTSRIWSVERRVDVFVTVETRAAIEERKNPYKKIRANIFKNYYPSIGVWRSIGVEHLIDQLENLDSKSDLFTIRREDVPKVLSLIAYYDIKEEQAVLRESKGPGGAAIVAEAFARWYRKEYEKALDRYEDALLQYWQAHPEMLKHTEESTEKMAEIVSLIRNS